MKQVFTLGAGIGCTMAALQMGNYIAVLLIVGILAFLLIRARVVKASGYAVIRGHTHEGPIHWVSVHEGGHADAAERVGGRVLDARVTGNDRSASGYTEVVIPNDPASQIGVYLAGFAAAPGTSSPTDQRMVDQVLAGVPAQYRGYVLREGQKIANSGRNSVIQGYARRLEQKRRL